MPPPRSISLQLLPQILGSRSRQPHTLQCIQYRSTAATSPTLFPERPSYDVHFLFFSRIYEEHIKKHVNNEAKLLMAFYLTTPVMNATNIANSPKVVDVSLSNRAWKLCQTSDRRLCHYFLDLRIVNAANKVKN